MSRLPQVADDQANTKQSELFAAVKKKLGRVPNFLRSLSHSTAALEGYLGFSGAVDKTQSLNARQREIVALAIGQTNGCEYCLAAHSTIGKMVGLSADEITSSRHGDGVEVADRAVARFASAVLESRGRVSDEQIEEFRKAGFGNDAVAEVVAHVALNVYTNFFNNVAEPEVDFPAAPHLEEVAMGQTCSTGTCNT